ncbi:TetR/AcrR family transcriptional regulator [Psychrobacter sp. SIMBA_152]|uniref:TetR/AcrR family transcriptional regulator n=1 Tax=unclassified Psychrobacter TaxID=196806 RepID=UPI002648D22B|nr:TetR/AcrR family transcriptional regulator [Psychrobacter sp.]MDN5619206.1 TetR/AcrR family transcriptional regulator [Psychrobacter sp.]
MSKKQLDILKTASELFNEHGYVSVGVDRIIRESSVSKMTFYKYFPSKDRLIQECLTNRDNLIRNSITQTLNSHKEKGIKKLEIFLKWYESWFNQKDFFGCMFIKATDEFMHDVKLNSIIINHKMWITNTIKNILKECSIENPELMADQIRIILDGAIINETTFRDGKSIVSSGLIIKTMLKI